jgi:hypothetical protein
MRLAVAGLEGSAIERRNRHLSRGDLSAFTPAERVAFRFIHKQAGDPAGITAEDFRRLERHFGKERALDLVWWSGHCHYMTRVADAFQLPLERENVFDGFRPIRKGPNDQ